MIHKIEMKNFKCFRNQEIELTPCTVLTGLNNSGKSSILQAINLVWNTDISHTHLGLDSFKNKYTTEEILSLVLHGKDKSSKNRKITRKYNTTNKAPVSKTHKYNIGDDFDFAWIFADRLGPQENLPYHSNKSPVGNIKNCGARGENTLSYLSELDNEATVVPFSVQDNDEEEIPLRISVEDWLQVISPGIEFDFTAIKNVNITYSLYNESPATMVGFGLSYSLPVIVELLARSTKRNGKKSILLIENPEAHLHPAGQTQMGKLIGKCVSQGCCQVILETHSEHIISGIRLALKHDILSSKDTLVYYISKEIIGKKIEPEINVKKIKIKQNGSIEKWPVGFFDEMEKNILELF